MKFAVPLSTVKVCFFPNNNQPVVFEGAHVHTGLVSVLPDDTETEGRYMAYITASGYLVLVKEEYDPAEVAEGYDDYPRFTKVLLCESEQEVWSFDRRGPFPHWSFIPFVKELGLKLKNDEFFFFEDLTDPPVPF